MSIKKYKYKKKKNYFNKQDIKEKTKEDIININNNEIHIENINNNEIETIDSHVINSDKNELMCYETLKFENDDNEKLVFNKSSPKKTHKKKNIFISRNNFIHKVYKPRSGSFKNNKPKKNKK